MADANAQARQQVKDSTDAKAKSVDEVFGKTVKPTPTQEENDLAKMGVPFETHEEDGSGPESGPMHKNQQGGKPGGYSTRAAAPAAPASPKS